MNTQCKCGKGYVSYHDGECGHCRTKEEARQLTKYHNELHAFQVKLRERYFGVPPEFGNS